eukprot:m.150147 g.150147  ORF g.150147 m.150147 type:complete len:467 (+) comp16309_c0_seq1:428-1828(+)
MVAMADFESTPNDEDVEKSLRRAIKSASVTHMRKLCLKTIGPTKTDELFQLLQSFAQDKNVPELALGCSKLLTTAEQQSLLIPELKRLLPAAVQTSFVTQLQNHIQLNTKLSTPANKGLSATPRTRSESSSLHQPSRFTQAKEPRQRSWSLRRSRRSKSESDAATVAIGSSFDVKLARKHGSFGFNLRGGSEYEIGLFISKLDAAGPAEAAGVRVGDQLLSVNKQPLDESSHANAVALIRGCKRLHCTLRRWGRVPDALLKQEALSWAPSGHSTAASDDFFDAMRRVNMEVTGDQALGMHIRGGKEYGIGVFVSQVDADSLAARAGLQVGDQICDCNGTDLDYLSHDEAVTLLTSSEHLFLTVKASASIPSHHYSVRAPAWRQPNLKSTPIKTIKRVTKTPRPMLALLEQTQTPSPSGLLSPQHSEEDDSPSRQDARLSRLSFLAGAVTAAEGWAKEEPSEDVSTL